MPATDDPTRNLGLRRDGATVRFVNVVECTVGRSMHLLIDLGVQGVLATTRLTTPVTAIERVTPDLDSEREES